MCRVRFEIGNCYYYIEALRLINGWRGYEPLSLRLITAVLRRVKTIHGSLSPSAPRAAVHAPRTVSVVAASQDNVGSSYPTPTRLS